MRLPVHLHGGAVELVTEVARRTGATVDDVLELVRQR